MIWRIPEINVLLVDYDDQVKYDLVTENKHWIHAKLLKFPVNLTKLLSPLLTALLKHYTLHIRLVCEENSDHGYSHFLTLS
jgi:hypothetical protein